MSTVAVVFYRLLKANKLAWTGKIFCERYWQNGHFWPPYFENSPRKQLLDEKTPVFWRFAKLLIVRLLAWFWQKKGFVEKKKSTPQKNLALTFENLACLQKREKGQNRSEKPAQMHGVCANFRLLHPVFSSGEGRKRGQNGHFSLKNASSPWTKISVKDFDKRSSSVIAPWWVRRAAHHSSGKTHK